MSETPMTEARIEEIVADADLLLEVIRTNCSEMIADEVRALLSGWRAKKEEIERLSEALEACRFQLNGGGPPHSEWRTKLMRQIDAALSGEVRAEPHK